MTDYMGRYMAPRRREWAVRHEGGILAQLHWILSEACAASNLRSELCFGDEQTRSSPKDDPKTEARLPDLAQQTVVVEVVGPAEPPQGLDVCRGWTTKPEKASGQRPTAHSDWPYRNRSTRPNRTCFYLVALRAARSSLYLAIHLGFHRMGRRTSDARIYKRTFDLN